MARMEGGNVVMTDIPAHPDDEEMLTTGQAAAVIGYGTTRKQVDAMVKTGELTSFRRDERKWAKIPLSAALEKRAELERQLRGGSAGGSEQDDAG